MSSRDGVTVLELTGERTPVGRLLKDFWAHRDLLTMLARQDYRSRYRSASLGLLWSVFLPLLQGVVIALVFTKLVGGNKAKIYIPYVVTGVTTWGYLQSSLTSASTSIVDGGAIAGRLYFPRLVLPTISPSANLPGLLISLSLAEVVALALGTGLHPTLLLLPGVVVLAWSLAFSAGAVLAMLHVYSRDVRYVVQATLLMLFYATPIIYFIGDRSGARALPQELVPYVLANPATGVVQLARFCISGEAAYVGTAVLVSIGWVLALLAVTVLTYARRERVACDRL